MTPTPSSVLIIEDEPDSREAMGESLSSSGFTVGMAGSGAEAIEKLRQFAYDAVVIDLKLPDADGLELLDSALAIYPNILAIMMTGFGGVSDAVSAMKRGAFEFLIKPFQLSQLARSVSTGLDQRRLRVENDELRAQLCDRYRFDNVIGESAGMRQVFSTLEMVAPLNSTVLIQGETGTGKELIARTLHFNSPRAEQRFVAFNAASIPDSLAEAELFGHSKGAFTGAVAARVGRFELAHRGTLFIDEVGLMPMPLQAKLLRAVQEREIERVGESRPVRFDARVVVATNSDLRKMVKEGTFREDLFYRLNVIPITLPSLRQRVEDIPLLARHFVHKVCRSNNLALKVLAQDTVRALMAYAWPGNIRQLENAIEYAVAMSGASREVPRRALPDEVTGPTEDTMLPMVSIPDDGIDFSSVVSKVERELILKCLEKTGGNKRQAARLLRLSRTTFIDKLQRLQLPKQASEEVEVA